MTCSCYYNEGPCPVCDAADAEMAEIEGLTINEMRRRDAEWASELADVFGS